MKKATSVFTPLSIARYNWHCIQFYKIVLFRFVWSRDALLARKEERASRYERRWTKTTCIVSRLVKTRRFWCYQTAPVGIVVKQSGSREREVVKVNSSLPSWPGPAEISYLVRNIFNAFHRIMRLRHILQYPNLNTKQQRPSTLLLFWAFHEAPFTSSADNRLVWNGK